MPLRLETRPSGLLVPVQDFGLRDVPNRDLVLGDDIALTAANLLGFDGTEPRRLRSTAGGFLQVAPGPSVNGWPAGRLPGNYTDGEVLYQDDMSGATLSWGAQAATTGSISRESTTPGRVGSSGASLKALTAAAPNDFIYVKRDVGDLPSHRIGFECWVLGLFGSAGQAYLTFELDWYDGAFQRTAQVRIQPDDIWWYLNSAGGYQTITGVPQPLFYDATSACWHHFKLIWDADAEQYVEMRVNRLVYNMRGIKSYKSANLTLPFVRFEFQLVANNAAVKTAWMMNACATWKQP